MTTEQTQNSEEEVPVDVEELAQRVSASRMTATRARAYSTAKTWATSEFRPPDPWSKGRPPVGDTWHYLTSGEQLPPEGPGRIGAIVYGAVVCLPLRFVLALLDWIVERPARLIFALVLLLVFAHTPYGSFIPWI